MLEQTRQYIESHQLFESNSRLLLAVSGGIDSMVCLNILHLLGYKCGIAHCNFQLRGHESERDEAFVRDTAAQIGIPFYCQNFNTVEYAKSKGQSIQMAARELRFDWFEKLRLSEAYDYLILAHHGDDSLETILINMTRGTGIKGLSGIQPNNGNICRPLLHSNRKDIQVYAKNQNIEYREDSSNKKTDYARNRIRHNIIPEFEKINPSFSKTAQANIEHFKQEHQVLEITFKNLCSKIVSENELEITLSIAELAKIQFRDWFLFRFLSEYGFNADQVNSLIAMLEEAPGKEFFSERYTLTKDRQFIFLYAREMEISDEFLIHEHVASITDPISLNMKVIEKSDHGLSARPNVACLDLNTLNFPLKLRKWHAGDSFQPLGMKKRKKLSDFFIDEKIPRHRKDRIWILCSRQDIVWIVGLRIDDRFKLTEDTRQVFQINLKA